MVLPSPVRLCVYCLSRLGLQTIPEDKVVGLLEQLVVSQKEVTCTVKPWSGDGGESTFAGSSFAELWDTCKKAFPNFGWDEVYGAESVMRLYLLPNARRVDTRIPIHDDASFEDLRKNCKIRACTVYVYQRAPSEYLSPTEAAEDSAWDSASSSNPQGGLGKSRGNGSSAGRSRGSAESVQEAFNRACIERDGERCCLCGGTGKHFSGAHLIEKCNDSKSDDFQSHVLNKKFGITGLYDVRNGIVLCQDCHFNRLGGFNNGYGLLMELGRSP